jgi:hypothetical protein
MKVTDRLERQHGRRPTTTPGCGDSDGADDEDEDDGSDDGSDADGSGNGTRGC